MATKATTKELQEDEGFLERLGKRLDNASIWHKRLLGVFAIIATISGTVVAINTNINNALNDHIDNHTQAITARIDENKQSIQNVMTEVEKVRMDTLRVQLLQYIYNEPQAHDTILKLAYTYFVEYNGDWVMTDKFKEWAEAEKVNIPFDLSH